jgi:hypothetical protein
MFKSLVLCGAILCLSLTAAAQDSAVASFDASAPADASALPSAPAAPAALYPSNREPWQVGIGFQFQQFDVLHRNFHTFGVNTDLTRFINDWFGIEGTLAAGFGHSGSNPSLDAKTLLVMGGPHITLTNNSKFEPWGHVLVGLDHLRFTQTSTLGSESKLGFMAGAGVDIKLGGRASWRVQGDFIGSRFGANSIDTSFSFGTGLIFNF